MTVQFIGQDSDDSNSDSEYDLDLEESDSDADDMEPPIDIYRQKYQLLLERCEVLQQDNDRLIHRFVYVTISIRYR